MAVRVLIIRPEPTGGAGEGDEVVHTKAIAHLKAAGMEVSIVALRTVGGLRRLFNLTRSIPPEIARHMSPPNPDLVLEGVRRFRPDVICLFNETSFPVLTAAKSTGVPVVLYAHNVHSQIVDADPRLISRAFRGAIRRFERRVYGDPAVELVCISKSDAEKIRATTHRARVWVAPPGLPPLKPLAPGAAAEPSLALTGAYGWWRKRIDLNRFAAEPANPAVRCFVGAGAAEQVVVPGAEPAEGLDWSSAIRVGLITDRFVAGFKLKSTEYVALNCAIASYGDISGEFAGLPHAERFVRTIAARSDAEAFALSLAADPSTPAAFAEFKAACAERFDWARTLEPLSEAIAAALARAPG